MRLSVNRDDPGYPKFAEKPGAFQVYVNGRDVTYRCVTVDEEAGFAVCHAIDANGDIIIDRRREEIFTEILRGEVIIKEAS